jgi:outer membrane protein
MNRISGGSTAGRLLGRSDLPVFCAALLLAAALILVAACAVCAESQGEVRLSVADAVALAGKNNETLLKAIEDENKAAGAVKEAWSGALPNVSLGGTYQDNFKQPVFFVTSDSSTIELQVGGDLEAQGQIRLDQVLYAFGRIGNAVKFAGIYNNIASLGVDNARNQVTYAAKEAYYRVLLMAQVAGIQRQSLRQAQSHQAEIEQKYAQGAASRFDLLRSQVETKNREPGVIQAENNLDLSVQDLKRVLGLGTDENPFLTDSLVYRPIRISEEEAVAEAMQHRPEILSLFLNVEGKKRLLAIEKSGRYPILGLYGQVQLQGESNYDDPLGALFDEDKRVVSSSAGISLSVPIFDGFRTKGRVRQARADLKKAEYELAEARKGLRLEVSKAVRDLASFEQEYESQVATVGLAEEAYRIAETRFRSGLSTQLELTDAETALDLARTNYARTLYGHNVAIANLERALGRTAGQQ